MLRERILDILLYEERKLALQDELRERYKVVQKKLKFTQKDVADLMNVDRSYISKWLTGKVNFDTRKLHIINEFLAVSEELIESREQAAE